TPAGTHGVNWGAKRGGGYYANVTNQHANVLTIIDPDPNGDGNGVDATAVGTILLANGSNGAGATDGTGGQGVKPLPMTHDGWIQPTVALLGTGRLAPEVEGWIRLLPPAQKDPSGDLYERANFYQIDEMCYLFISGLPLRHARYRTSHIKSNNGGTFSIR